MKLSNKRWLSLCFLLLAASCFVQAQETKGFIFLVRHAEKISRAPDALLSKEGLQRSQCLARTLHDANIKSIYVTDVVRTQQTAAPLAKALNLTPKIVRIESAEQNATELARRLRHAGSGNVLVVNHSDALPLLLQKLGGGKVEVGDLEFDQLFVLAPDGQGKARLATMHYCVVR